MAEERKWTSTKGQGSGKTWDPKKDDEGNVRVEATDNDFLEGFYFKRTDGVGQYKSTVVVIQDDQGVNTDVWCDTVLKGEMDKQRIGSYLRLQWLGRRVKKSSEHKLPKQRKNDDFFNDWEVFVDNDTPPISVEGSAAAAPASHEPAKTQQQSNGNGNAQQIRKPADKPAAADDLPF
jgi:hypothetical protein